MLRAVFAVVLLLALPIAPAHACSLETHARPARVAAYVEAARPCLLAPPEGLAFDADLEARFLDLVNRERRLAGLAPVRPRAELLPAARFHSLDMAANGFFGHEGRDGRGPQDRIAALDRTALADFTAENVASISRTGGRMNADFALRRLHGNLMGSPGHRANILHPKATHAAFGVVRTREGVWVTQLYMSLAGSLSREAPLRLASPGGLAQPHGLSGWEFVRYEIVSPSGKPLPGGLRLSPGLDARLAAYATQPGDEPRSYYWMHIPGPAVTLSR
jgi:uncharacterized protein YkwD